MNEALLYNSSTYKGFIVGDKVIITNSSLKTYNKIGRILGFEYSNYSRTNILAVVRLKYNIIKVNINSISLNLPDNNYLIRYYLDEENDSRNEFEFNTKTSNPKLAVYHLYKSIHPDIKNLMKTTMIDIFVKNDNVTLNFFILYLTTFYSEIHIISVQQINPICLYQMEV